MKGLLATSRTLPMAEDLAALSNVACSDIA